MGCGDDDAAAAQVRLHDGGERGLGCGVERRRRLVEQPQRAMGDEETGERHAAPLPGREQAGGKIDHMGEADPRQRGALRLARGSAAEHRRGEGEVLARGQRAFDAVGVAEIMGLLAERAFGVAALERKPPASSGRKPQRARNRLDFPAPFGPVTISAAPRFRRERKSGEEPPPAAFDRQIPRAKAH